MEDLMTKQICSLVPRRSSLFYPQDQHAIVKNAWDYVDIDQMSSITSMQNMERTTTLETLFKEAALNYSNNTAVTYINNEDEEEHITYNELDDIAFQISSCFAQLKASNTIIAVFSRQSTNLIALLLGILKTRAAFAPIGLEWPPSMVEQFIKSITLNLKVVVVEEELVEEFNKIINLLNRNTEEKLKKVDDQTLLSNGFVIYSRHGDFRCENFEHNLAYVMQTSGTTGSPKTVRVPQQCIVPNITSVASIFGVCCEDCVALLSPYTFDPFVVQLFLALSSGARVAIIPENVKLQPEKLCKLLFEKLRTTILQPTPSLIYMIGHQYMTTKLLSQDSSLRVLAFGGEPCPSKQSLQEWKHQDCKTEIFDLYGITEVSCWASCHKITNNDFQTISDKDVQDVGDADKIVRCDRIPLGICLDGTVIDVRDSEGNIINEGFGTIHIGGEKRVCYIDKETVPKTMRSTGDLGYIHNGQIWYCGRQNRQIKRMGKRMNLEWLEQTLSKEIPNLVFTAVAEPTGGIPQDKICLFVKPPSFYNSSSLVSLIHKTLHNSLPEYAHPDYIYVVDTVPITTHGKVDTKKLLKDYRKENEHFNLSVHEFLMTIWRRAVRNNPSFHQNIIFDKGESTNNDRELGNMLYDSIESEDVTVKDDDKFIENGGTSLDAIRMAGEIESWVSRKALSPVELPELLEVVLNETFGNLCRYVERKLSGKEASLQLTPGALEGTLSASQDEEKFDQMISNTSKHRETISRKHNYIVEISNSNTAIDLMPQRKRIKNDEPSSPSERDLACFCSIQRGNHLTKCPLHANMHNEKPFIVSSTERPSKLEIKVDLHWKVDFHKCIDASPLVACINMDNSLVYIGSHACVFKAVSVVDGKVLWETRVGDRIESSAAISKCGCFIIVGCYDGKVYIFSRDSGTIIWTFQTGGQVKSSPRVDPSTGFIWIGSHDHNLYSLDVDKRKCVASFDCGASCFSSPCVLASHQLVFIATLRGRLLAVCTSQMIIKWTCQCPKPVFSSPFATSDGVLCGCVDGKIYFYSLSGKLQWQFDSSGPVFSSPSVFLSDIVFGCHDKCVYCISSSGQLKWKFTADSEVYSTPFVTLLNVTRDESCAKSVCTENLQHTQKHDINNRTCSPQEYTKPVVVVCSTKGTLYCLCLCSGQLLTTWSMSGPVFSSPVVIGNRILIGCRDEYLYCLNISLHQV